MCLPWIKARDSHAPVAAKAYAEEQNPWILTLETAPFVVQSISMFGTGSLLKMVWIF